MTIKKERLKSGIRSYAFFGACLKWVERAVKQNSAHKFGGKFKSKLDKLCSEVKVT